MQFPDQTFKAYANDEMGLEVARYIEVISVSFCSYLNVFISFGLHHTTCLYVSLGLD